MNTGMESISQERHIDMLEKIQSRATKLILGLRDLRRTIKGMWTNNTRNAQVKGGGSNRRV